MPRKDLLKAREQNKIAQRKYYALNSKYYKDKAKENKRQNRIWFSDYKKTISCERCGENHPACLDFHHIDSKEKRYLVSRMPGVGASINTMLKEIEKCIVLCSNCHRKEHSKNK